MQNFSHTPVLLNEAVEHLNIKSGKKYIDATLGGGGHSREIINKGGMVLGIDQDEDAIEFVKNKQETINNKLKITIVKGNFKDIASLAKDNGFEKVDGILLDLGVSSYQLDNSGRGFSYRKDEVLDMRMDKEEQLTALDVVNSYPRESLIDILSRNGEVHNAKKIVDEILEKRKRNEIRTTGQLSQIVVTVVGRSGLKNPATQVFQAIRIEVNGEIEAAKFAIADSLGLLNSGGRLVVISFHSLEDRLVKKAFAAFERNKKGKLITKKPITVGEEEFIKNRRSRSAKMRVFEAF